MPEHNCVNIGVEGYPVWLTLTPKTTIVVIEPAGYKETGENLGNIKPLLTSVTVVVNGEAIYVRTPATVEEVCERLGFIWPEKLEEARPEIGDSQ